jgi:hypothetical protein
LARAIEEFAGAALVAEVNMYPVVFVIMVLNFTPHKHDAHWVPLGGVYSTLKECRENLGNPPGYPGNIVHGEYADDPRSAIPQRCVAYMPGKVLAIAKPPPPGPPFWYLEESENTHALGTFGAKEDCEEMLGKMVKAKAEAGHTTTAYRCLIGHSAQ